MWNQLSSFAADIRERAEHAARDAGFEDQVVSPVFAAKLPCAQLLGSLLNPSPLLLQSRARQQVDALAESVLSLEPSPTKDEDHQQVQPD